VQESFELYHETLYVGVKILDNFLMKCPVQRENLQLVGAASLFIACKVEVRTVFFSLYVFLSKVLMEAAI
jgi:cyclin B